jgi:hypothetical protein
MKHWKGERYDAKLPGSARGSRAGDRVLAIANFHFSGLFGRNSIRARCILLRMPPLKYFGEAAEMCTRRACSPEQADAFSTGRRLQWDHCRDWPALI